VESCDSGFLRRALNNGLPVMICPGIHAAVRDGDVISADPATGTVTLADRRVLRSRPFSERMLQVWQAGGSIPLLEREFAARRAATA
jgi:3-isopropylmalate/(R)-2-methylmalate dehydratase small subunit